jgi:hypothetical protein
MALHHLPRAIEVYDIGTRRIYVKQGVRTFAICDDDLTPEELLGIAADISARQRNPAEAEIGMVSAAECVH